MAVVVVGVHTGPMSVLTGPAEAADEGCDSDEAIVDLLQAPQPTQPKQAMTVAFQPEFMLDCELSGLKRLCFRRGL